MRKLLISTILNRIYAKKWLVGLYCLFLYLPLQAYAESSLNDISVQGTSKGAVEVALKFSMPVTEPKSFSTEAPARVVLDFSNVKLALKEEHKGIAINMLQSYDALQAGNRLRIVFNMEEQTPYSIRMSGSTVYLTVQGKSPVVEHAKLERYAANPWSKRKHQIKAIDFRRDDSGSGRVIVDLSDSELGMTIDKRNRDIVIEYIDTGVAKQLQRKLDVTDFGTPIDTITTKQKGKNVQMMIKGHGDFDHLAYQINNQFIVDISKQRRTSSSSSTQKADEIVYKGEKLSLNFQSISVRAVLQLLADFTGTNIVASDSVSGVITLRLNNVPWDEALAIILKTQGLGVRKIGGVMMIAPTEEIAAREKERLESTKQVEELEPLVTELMQLNYANVSDIAGLLQDKSSTLLSSRGNVNIDKRTNNLLIQDTEVILQTLVPLIRQLDVPVQQVLIEARIVTVDTDYEKDLGIRFGITHPSHVSGTIGSRSTGGLFEGGGGANEINNNALRNPGTNPVIGVPVDSRLNVNLPAEPDTTTATSIGVALAKLGRHYLLDLELSALESEGVGELISSPRLVTANQQEAYIEQGEEIPYQEATSSGATSVEFKKAVLALRVTPQITPDNKIIMDIKINQDRRSSKPEVLGVPAIDTEQIATHVLVENGQTIVLGGIYREDQQNKVERVPFLGELPVIGYLFKRTKDIERRRELLIFITPKIVQQTPIV